MNVEYMWMYDGVYGGKWVCIMGIHGCLIGIQ